MAFLHITVWDSATHVANGDPVQHSQIATLTGSNQQTAAISGSNRDRKRVRIAVDGNCWVNFGDNAVATDATDSFPMGTDVSTVEYFDIESGHVVAAVTRS